MLNSKYHRAFGVYGIYLENDKMLVINKNSGPYINRFDLPGGSLEADETLSQALKREFYEETGLEIEIVKNIGAIDFKVSWLWKGFEGVHHIAVNYIVRKIGGKLNIPEQFKGQDSLGTEWVTEKEVSVANASPLVLKAFEWKNTKKLGVEAMIYRNWEVMNEIVNK